MSSAEVRVPGRGPGPEWGNETCIAKCKRMKMKDERAHCRVQRMSPTNIKKGLIGKVRIKAEDECYAMELESCDSNPNCFNDDR